MAAIQYLTPEGLQKLKEEIAYLTTKGRAEMSRQIAEAREKGDLSENAEYDAAKEAQGHLEAKIARLQETLAAARIVDDSNLDANKALILSTVEILNKKTNKLQTFTLVSENEADLKAGRISVTSPIGKGLLGKSVGDTAVIETPSGKLEFELKKITR
ncbi:MAG: transcription elongation factor GreA [Chitinophagales bacterium]|nr:transcription elongation factor GreA [Chitinophagales bacterium]